MTTQPDSPGVTRNLPDQFGRKVGLFVGPAGGGKGIDLSAMHIRFRTYAQDKYTPPRAEIEIFNLRDDTQNLIQKEFQEVTLQAGYETGNFGTIFQGSIKQFAKGKDNPTDKYLKLYCADSYAMFNFCQMNKFLDPGSTAKDTVDAMVDSLKQYNVKINDPFKMLTFSGTQPKNLNGKVMFGLLRNPLTALCTSAGATWLIRDGQIFIVPIKGYLPGTIVQFNAKTGLVNIPESTPQGIVMDSLLNPYVKTSSLVQINNKDINTTQVINYYPGYSDLDFYAAVTEDGFYRALSIEQEGDTRGNPWYTHIVGLAVDISAAPENSVPGAF